MNLPPNEVVALITSLVARAGSAARFVGGTIGFRIHGANGGTWVLDLSVEGGRMSVADDAAFESAATRVYSYAHDFAALLVTPDAMVGLLESGRIIVEGDLGRLRRLSKLIQRP